MRQYKKRNKKVREMKDLKKMFSLDLYRNTTVATRLRDTTYYVIRKN